uniref:restriction endonuclease subunit S n=1 Tax=Gluconobacter thailandicus TaxID=257438 RepID=UPI0009EF1F3C|nr:restriction endonuclease subunit S [Gluconobacter thailandicus]
MLPNGWVETKLEDFCDVTAGQSPAGHLINKTEEGLPFFQGKGEFGTDYPGAKNWCLHPPKQAERNDILISVRAPVGPTNYAPEACGIGRGLASVTPLQNIPSSFVRNTLRVMEPELKSKATGSTFEAITTKVLKNSKVHLPPLAEQRRIVAKLDSLTARIARARAELERVQQLRGAFTARFLRKIFSAEIEKYFPLREVITSIDAGKNLKCEERPPKRNELGIVKVSAVSSEIFRPEEAKTLPQSYLPPERDLITNGDVLLARASGSLKLVGRIAVAERCDGNLYLSDKVLRINIDKTWKDWVVWFLRSPLGREQIESFSSGISMHNIGQNNFKRIKIPFVDLPGREGKISSLIRGLKDINHLETEAQRALTLLNRLESSLLAKAFRGELVPQDPNDEAASVLLDRIRAERAAAPKPKRGRRQSTQDMPLPRKRQTEKHD